MNGILISATGKVALCDLCVEIPATVVHENTWHVCPECLGHLASAGAALEKAGMPVMDPFLQQLSKVTSSIKRKFSDGGAA